MYYFAYASNLSKKQMLERCPNSKPLFRATLANHKLIFTGWSRKWRGGVATIRASRDDKVSGAVYEISDRCLNVLDQPPIIVPLPKLELPTWIYDPSLCSITKSFQSA